MKVASWCLILVSLCGVYACRGTYPIFGDEGIPCRSTFAFVTGPAPGYSSPSTATLVLDGSLISGESVKVSYTDVNQQSQSVTTHLTADSSSITVVPLPSGTRSYTVSVSCTTGGAGPWQQNFTIK